jgi:hypothetical protein
LWITISKNTYNPFICSLRVSFFIFPLFFYPFLFYLPLSLFPFFSFSFVFPFICFFSFSYFSFLHYFTTDLLSSSPLPLPSFSINIPMKVGWCKSAQEAHGWRCGAHDGGARRVAWYAVKRQLHGGVVGAAPTSPPLWLIRRCRWRTRCGHCALRMYYS